MALTVRLTQTCVEGDTTYSGATSHTCATVAKLEETIVTGTTDQEHIIGIDISALKCFFMVCDQVVTVETNSGSVPDDTFTMIADYPVTFQTGETAIFTADVTKIFVTNSSGSTATLKIIAGQDV